MRTIRTLSFLNQKRVIAERWNESWPQEFEKIVKSLGDEIIKSTLRIEHVGSTSVRGLSAKPIIDLDLVIEDDDSFPEIRALLEARGYIYEGNLGIVDREVFKYKNKPELMTHHLYVCPKASGELHRHIAFRDCLRNNPSLVAEYSEVKEEAARLYPEDIEKYMEYKAPVIERIYKQLGLI